MKTKQSPSQARRNAVAAAKSAIARAQADAYETRVAATRLRNILQAAKIEGSPAVADAKSERQDKLDKSSRAILAYLTSKG